MMRELSKAGVLAALLVACPLAASAQPAPGWSAYENPAYGFSAELPLNRFNATEPQTPQSLRLLEENGPGEIRVFAGDVPEGASLDALEDQLSADPRIREVTYRADGDTWFVVSGYFKEETASGSPVVFYAKLLLSRDSARYSAFEISYPQDDRENYDFVVGRIEDSLTRPQ